MDPASPKTPDGASAAGFDAPYPGVKAMPRWDAGTLPEAPRFRWTQIAMFIGPGLVMGASAIGGGEWLTGPLVTARYGGALLWLATLSVLFQTIYNVEISRYTLYTGEPIFTGKFRLPPSPIFWLWLYLILDLGSVLPYLASNAAIPAAAMILGRIPASTSTDITWTFLGTGFTDSALLKLLACLIFASVFIPLSVGGKVYNSLKAVMTFKLVTVIGFLMFLAVCYSTPSTWYEIGTGFFKFGTIPVTHPLDLNGNGKVDEGEEYFEGSTATDNVFMAMAEGRKFPWLDLSMIGILASMAAISGNGGLTNTPMSNYTRDQGWGMGAHVGAIPSIVGGHAIELSHVGMVFNPTPETLPRWKQWLYHVRREQWCLWLPACFIGLALPSMLSVQFLEKGKVLKDQWQAAAMTAGGVADRLEGLEPNQRMRDAKTDEEKAAALAYDKGVAGRTGWPRLFWFLTLFCGFLVLGTSMASTADGVLRRWVDVFWTALPFLRKWDTRHIGKLYFGVLCVYLVFGLIMLTLVPGDKLLIAATGILYNYALGFSCAHTLFVNQVLLPKPLRPNWLTCTMLVFGSIFFTTIAVISSIDGGPKLYQTFLETFGLLQK